MRSFHYSHLSSWLFPDATRARLLVASFTVAALLVSAVASPAHAARGRPGSSLTLRARGAQENRAIVVTLSTAPRASCGLTGPAGPTRAVSMKLVASRSGRARKRIKLQDSAVTGQYRYTATCRRGGRKARAKFTVAVTLVATTPQTTGGGNTTPGGMPGRTLPEKWSDETTSSGPPGFLSCHGMHTTATLYSNTGKVYGSTDIWSRCAGGFTGTAAVLLQNAEGVTIGKVMAPESWGVEGLVGKVFGFQNERADLFWKAAVSDPDDLVIVDRIEVVNTWAPRDRLEEIINKAIAAGKRVAEVIQMVAAYTG